MKIYKSEDVTVYSNKELTQDKVKEFVEAATAHYGAISELYVNVFENGEDDGLVSFHFKRET